MIFFPDLSFYWIFKNKTVCVFSQSRNDYRVHLQFSKTECGIFSFFNIILCCHYTITNNVYQQICNNLLKLELPCTFYTNGFLGIWHSNFHKKT